MKNHYGQKFRFPQAAFTLMELLMVIAVLSLLLSIIIPALAAAKVQARSALCKSNLRGMLTASNNYSCENDDFFVPAAEDFLLPAGGFQRWHGTRTNKNEPFDPLRGPLTDYFGGGGIKQCPENVEFVQTASWNASFENGCGGYGYNMTYLGSIIWKPGLNTLDKYMEAYRITSRTSQVGSPSQTLEFTDCAMAKQQKGQPYFLEYSFAEPPFTVVNGKPLTTIYMSPSLHFRHNKSVNVGWVDGHVDSPIMAPFNQKNAYGVLSSSMMLGWFKPLNNTPFTLK